MISCKIHIFVGLTNEILTMPKKLRTTQTYIAQDILGRLDTNGYPRVKDERNENIQLDIHNIDDKITIYERQVKEWFFLPAEKLFKVRKCNGRFAALMICLSYIEGVEQYIKGESSRNNSRESFVSGMNRLYPEVDRNNAFEAFYIDARCGLFHNGMTGSRLVLSNKLSTAIDFSDDSIKVNPKRFFQDIKCDFESYLSQLRDNNNNVLRNNFDRLYTID